MSDRKTLSELLRDEGVYRPAGPAASVAREQAGDQAWRLALLAEFEHGPALRPARPAEPRPAPLTLHHLALLAPAGATLFVLGWLAGSGRFDLASLAGLPPLMWAGLAAAGSLGWWLWRGTGLGRTR